jgi:hypothetical protein
MGHVSRNLLAFITIDHLIHFDKSFNILEILYPSRDDMQMPAFYFS